MSASVVRFVGTHQQGAASSREVCLATPAECFDAWACSIFTMLVALLLLLLLP
jgi:hypothetical protein